MNKLHFSSWLFLNVAQHNGSSQCAFSFQQNTKICIYFVFHVQSSLQNMCIYFFLSFTINHTINSLSSCCPALPRLSWTLSSHCHFLLKPSVVFVSYVSGGRQGKYPLCLNQWQVQHYFQGYPHLVTSEYRLKDLCICKMLYPQKEMVSKREIILFV